MEVFPAHIRIGAAGEQQIQTTGEHCRKVAEYTANSLKPVKLSCAGELVGLLHDAGKFCAAFSQYIASAAAHEPVRRGSVNHTFTGVHLLFERYYQKNGNQYRNMTCEILAAAAGSHHGLFDCVDPKGEDGFAHRLDEVRNPYYREAKKNFLLQGSDFATLDKLFDQAADEMKAVLELCKGAVGNQTELAFFVALLCRLLLSALIDADRRDTAEFCHELYFPEAPWDMRPIWAERLAAVEQRLNQLSSDSPINQARRSISQQCRDFPAGESGIYRLSVPTGSGKTLATLRFALATAEQYNKSRILFVIPLLSVLEQNAQVLREYLEDDALILEHHSNVLRVESSPEKLNENELLTESWKAPVMITTMVQLLDTLFSDKTTCVRRMNALENSVIIIDEIQSLPKHMTSQFSLAINFLSRVCHATVVLCSATQPCFEKTVHPMRYSEPASLVPYDPALWQLFRRARIIDRCRPAGYTAEELAAMVLELLPEVQSLLFICNKKDQAECLYRQLCHAKAQVFHLSTGMCMAHRMDTMERIRAGLGKNPVICVATQLVEAGVDFSFGSVIRVSAGMDNVIQAAGRCNRNGEAGRICPVYIVNWRDENLSRLKEIREAQRAAEELMYRFQQNSADFDGDLQSDAAIYYYYHRLFSAMAMEAQDYPISSPEYQTTMVKLLSVNQDFPRQKAMPGSHVIEQAFRTAGREFKVFDDNTTDVLVPYGEGAALISALGSQRAQYDFSYRKELIDQAKRYSVSLFNYQRNALTDSGGLCLLCQEAILAVLPAFYREDTGINMNGGANRFMEV